MERCDPQEVTDSPGLHSSVGLSSIGGGLAACFSSINNAKNKVAHDFLSARIHTLHGLPQKETRLSSPPQRRQGASGENKPLGIIHRCSPAPRSLCGKVLLSPQGNSFHVLSPNIPNTTAITTWKKIRVISFHVIIFKG